MSGTNTASAKGKKWMVILIVVGVVSIGGGMAAPMLLASLMSPVASSEASTGHKPAASGGHGPAKASPGGGHSSSGGHGAHGKPAAAAPKGNQHEAFLPFGDMITVNLADGRLNRYLRCKLVVVSEQSSSAQVTEWLDNNKAVLQNWLIAHLSDKQLKDVTGRASINRIRREILEHFNNALKPEGQEPLRDILFVEFVVQ